MLNARKNNKAFNVLAAVTVAASLIVAPLVSAGAAVADEGLVGTVGVMVPATSEANSPKYWENYTDHAATCYKHEGNSDHGTLTDGGKTVTLKPYQQSWPGDHWELLVVKAGNTNNVIVHPQAGVAYASPLNNGGQQATVSHWIVCKGTAPFTQPTVVTPTLDVTLPTCLTAGAVTRSENVSWASVVNADGTTTWTASPLAGTVFADGVKTQWTVPKLDKLPSDSEGCRPTKPGPEVSSTETSTYDCTSKTVTVTTVTTTTSYVWSEGQWVKATPEVVTTTAERAMTIDEKKDCPLPDTVIETSPWQDGEWECGDTQVTQTRTVTTKVWGYNELGEPAVTSSLVTEEQTRDLTQAEISECPLVPGEILASCIGDVPYLGYAVTLPTGYVNEDPNPLTITFVNPDGEDYTISGKALSGSVLWPGASATEPKMWPGWEIVDGTYVKTGGNFGWTREDITIRFQVNPTFETVVHYPAASALCANPPKQAISPETPDEETPTTGTPGTPASDTPDGGAPLAATGGGVSPILPIAGGAAMLLGIAVVTMVAFQRRRTTA